MRTTAFAAVALLAMAAPAWAAKASKFSSQLGEILGSEKACGLRFDDEAIRAIIEKNTSADVYFTMYISVAEARSERMGSAQLAVHCFQTKRSAEFLGLFAK
jgi:hypothetical protein